MPSGIQPCGRQPLFPLSAWKLAEIQQLVRQYASPFASLRVINPVYERVNVHCKAILWDSVRIKARQSGNLLFWHRTISHRGIGKKKFQCLGNVTPTRNFMPEW